MYSEDVTARCRTEHEAVRRVCDALRITLHWKAPAVGIPRKLSSVAFILRSLQRHLERRLALEEQGGYLRGVAEARPHLHPAAQRLRSQHDSLREWLETLLPSVDALKPDDDGQLNEVCNEIDRLLKQIEAHDVAEADLLQEALLTDIGGEGG